jgi:hypothetical protein
MIKEKEEREEETGASYFNSFVANKRKKKNQFPDANLMHGKETPRITKN